MKLIHTKSHVYKQICNYIDLMKMEMFEAFISSCELYQSPSKLQQH